MTVVLRTPRALLAHISAFCALSGCGDDAEGNPSPQRDASQQEVEAGIASPDSSVNSPSDSGQGQTARDDASANDVDAGAAPADAGFAGFEPSVALQVPVTPTSTANVIGDVSASAPTCAADRVACNGVCLAAGQSSAGCRVIATGTGQLRGLALAGDRAVFLTNAREGALQRVDLDGSDRQTLASVTLFSSSFAGVFDDRLLIWGSVGVSKDSAYWYALNDGAQTPAFPDLVGGRAPLVAGASLITLKELSLGVYQLARRALPDGAEQASTILGSVQNLVSDGEWVITSLGRGGSSTPTEVAVVRADGTGTSYGSLSDPSVFSPKSVYHVWLGGGFAHWMLNYDRYQRLNLQTGQLEASIAISLGNIYDVVGDDQASYFRQNTPEADRIFRLPHTGGDLTMVASFASGEVSELTARSGHLYVGLGYAQAIGIVDITLP